ncbi:expressed unknown protein [Seminavis robusta]|uniref:Right handed beta helix domain-containing protein n=1 Tax=Seminavis robusta TaxID=568900 RepID=A0A9N8HYN4_9STRA|nr:expressed unknown protein [Seminavis robusta]|eukprot:Sro2924_g340360.1 n/a (600) ;mRNA; r:4040-5839
MRIVSAVPLILASSLVLPLCHGQRVQSEDIVDDEVWTVDNSTIVQISQDISVAQDASLTVAEGVTVNFTGPFSVSVSGKVILRGTESNPVTVSNGFKAFSLMELDEAGEYPELEAEYTLFVNNTGGAIMREWPTSEAPVIKVEDCQFRNNQYAVRAYRAELENVNIQGGRIGVSLHDSLVKSTVIDGMDEICAFASSESVINNSTFTNCGTIGAWIGGTISDTTVINVTEGIVAATGGFGGLVSTQVDNCVVRGASAFGFRYIETVTDSVVLDSPDAIGATFHSGSISGSVIAGSLIGIQTGNPDGETAEVAIADSYICGNSRTQFDARLEPGFSNATQTFFGDTGSNPESLGEDFFQALPFNEAALGVLVYDLTDNVPVVIVPLDEVALFTREDIDIEALCGALPPVITSSPTLSPTVAVTVVATEVETGAPTSASVTSSPTETPTVIQTVAATNTDVPTAEAEIDTGTPTLAVAITSAPSTEFGGLPAQTLAASSETPSSVLFAQTQATETEVPTIELSMGPTEMETFLDTFTDMPTVSEAPTIPPTTPQPTAPQRKVAPPAKCGSIGLAGGRGGAAGQAKGCTSGRRNTRRRLKGL